MHQFLDHRGRKSVADRLAKIMLSGKISPENISPSKLLHNRSQFVYHLSPIIATNVVIIK